MLFRSNSDPNGDATGAIKFGALWQVGRLVIEKNIIEMMFNPVLDAFVYPAPLDPTTRPLAGTTFGIELFALANNAATNPCVFQQVEIRGNVIRHVDNASCIAPPYYHFGIYLNGCLNAVIENNIINAVTPMEQVLAGTLKYFRNQTPSGQLIQGHDFTLSQFVND